MRSFRFAAFCAAVVSTAAIAQGQDLNRLDLHNGTEVLWLLSTPFQGAPVSNFDPTGDLYWKAFPADALLRNDGTGNLMGIEAVVFDTDFFSSETLWSYTITTGTTATDASILPTFTGGGVFVPGTSTTGTIFGSAGCAGPGYLSGWVYAETFVDTATSLPTPLIADLTADGAVDWVFTHYFPAPGIADHDLSSTGPINSCGTTGDATLQWGGSTNEQMADWTGLGISGYGGFNIGGGGTFSPIPDANTAGSELGWFFEEATMTPGVVGTISGASFSGVGLDFGTVALRTPSACPPNPAVTLTKRMYDQGADTPPNCSISLFAGTLGPPLPFSFTFLGVPYRLNPADPAWVPTFMACNTPFNHFYMTDPNGPNPRSSFSDSNPIGVGCWTGTTISWQGITYDLCGGGATASSQVFRQHIH